MRELSVRIFRRFAHLSIPLYLIFTLVIAITVSYASSDKKLRVGVTKDEPKLSFVDENDSSYKGFSVDLAKVLADSMDLTAEIFPMNDSDLIAALNDGEIDVAIGVMDSSYSTVNVIKTSVQVNRQYFVNHRYYPFVPSKDLSGLTVAVEKGRDISRLLPLQTNMNFVEAESQEEALDLVDSGKAQVYMSSDSGSTAYLMSKRGFHNIRQVGVPIEIAPLVLAIDKNKPELLTALSIAYGQILEDGRYHRAFYKWLGSDLRMVIAKYRNHILIAAFFTAFIFLAFIIWNFVLKRKVTKINKNLQVSEQKYKDLIESSPDMIHLISSNGEIMLMNKIALKHLGYKKDERVYLRLHDLVIPEQTGNVTDFINRAFLDKYPNEEFTITTKNGNKINVEMVAALLKEGKSSENLACCFSRDLTDRKRLEEKLIHSERLALMGRMAAGIAHEINNPLWIILSNAEDMLNHKLSREELNECLKSIERNGLRAAKSIEDLLNFASPAPMQVVAIDLIKLIEDSLIFLRQKLKEKNIRVEKKYFSESVFLNGDENLIQQLLINIILNAIQALSRKGLIKISVNLTEKNGNREIIMEISDNGRGVPDSELKCIFDPFFTSGKTKGFGLGLFMSKMIAEKHGAILSIKSKPGKGTYVTINFPVKKEEIFETHNIGRERIGL